MQHGLYIIILRAAFSFLCLNFWKTQYFLKPLNFWNLFMDSANIGSSECPAGSCSFYVLYLQVYITTLFVDHFVNYMPFSWYRNEETPENWTCHKLSFSIGTCYISGLKQRYNYGRVSRAFVLGSTPSGDKSDSASSSSVEIPKWHHILTTSLSWVPGLLNTTLVLSTCDIMNIVLDYTHTL